MKSIVLLLLAFTVIGECKKEMVIGHPPGPPPHAKAYGYRAKYIYLYYPGAKIYYSPESEIYAVMEDGKWVNVNNLPAGITLENYVVIESDAWPWLNHSYHKEKETPVKVKFKGKGK